jgi:hypothetical protein
MFLFQRLLKLKSDGTELVTNVQVAGDARENVRRVEEEENKRQRFAMFCINKFPGILQVNNSSV